MKVTEQVIRAKEPFNHLVMRFFLPVARRHEWIHQMITSKGRSQLRSMW